MGKRGIPPDARPWSGTLMDSTSTPPLGAGTTRGHQGGRARPRHPLRHQRTFSEGVRGLREAAEGWGQSVLWEDGCQGSRSSPKQTPGFDNWRYRERKKFVHTMTYMFLGVGQNQLFHIYYNFSKKEQLPVFMTQDACCTCARIPS